MLPTTRTKTKQKPPRREDGRFTEGGRFPGICADAKALGVNRVTLWRVLSGHRTDLSGLKARYEALKRQQQLRGNAA